jgi:hypothetical protein
MENNEMLEQTNETENVDTQTTEENGEGIELTDTSKTSESDVVDDATSNDETDEKEEVRTFTQEEVDAIVQKRLARKERDFQKELSKYKSAEEVLKTGLGATDINDAEDKLREYWGEQGMKMPERVKPGLTQHQLEVLAQDEANEFIEEGYESMKAEANRLASKGYQNLNESEKIIFNKLAETLTNEDNKKALLKLGASEDILSDKSFNDFRKKFNSNVPINEIYDMYMKNNKKKTVKENPGSMKNSDVNITKDYYTPEELSKLTEEDLDDPKVWEVARKSMYKNGTKNYYE